jgi:hypothetical protein
MWINAWLNLPSITNKPSDDAKREKLAVAKTPPKQKVNDDPKLVFQYGEMYRRAWRALQVNRLVMPSVVCAALSLELYFKALIIDEKGDALETHDLQLLFSQLSQDKQKKIREFFQLTLQARTKTQQQLNQALHRTMPVPTFDQVLDSAKRVFISFRYGYQTSKLKQWEGWRADEIWDGTRKLILDLHPGWASL